MKTGSLNANKYGITQHFGNYLGGYYKKYGYKGHPGLDTGQRTGSNVYCEQTGYVTESYSAAQGGSAGQYVVIRDGSKRRWRYLHLSKRLVRVGQLVKRGAVIGKSGATGDVTGPHLHTDLRPRLYNPWNGYKGLVSPLNFLNDHYLNKPTYYTVKRGDTVSAICVKYKISLAAFRKMNPKIVNLNIIYPGQKVRVK